MYSILTQSILVLLFSPFHHLASCELSQENSRKIQHVIFYLHCIILFWLNRNHTRGDSLLSSTNVRELTDFFAEVTA